MRRSASDLHITAGVPPMIRVRGRLVPLEGFPVLGGQETREIVYSILNNDQRQRFETDWQLDFAYAIPGARPLPRQRLLPARLDRRRLPPDPAPRSSSIETLGLPPVAARVHQASRAASCSSPGPTGSGKSTSLAAMIDVINETREEHILTIEDPIEFLHRAQEVHRQPARDRRRRAELRARPARPPCARTPT